jgi:hypothetical protein
MEVDLRAHVAVRCEDIGTSQGQRAQVVSLNMRLLLSRVERDSGENAQNLHNVSRLGLHSIEARGVLNGNFYLTAETTSAAGLWRTRQNAKLFVSAQAAICRCIGHSLHMLHWGYIQLRLPRVIHYTREPRSSLFTAEAPCGRLTRSIRKSSKCLQKYWRCRQCNSHRRRLDFMRFCQEVHDFRKAYSGHDARTLCVAERCCQRTA